MTDVNINQGEIDSIRLIDQGSDPTTPPTDRNQLYAKDGFLYLIDSAGVVRVHGSGRVLISEKTPTNTTASFTSIPNTYQHLLIEYIARTDVGAASDGGNIYFNTDTTATNYYRECLSAADTTAAATEADDAAIILIPGASGLANNAGVGTIWIPYYAKTTFHKLAISNGGYREAAAKQVYRAYVVNWEATTAISQVDIVVTGNYISGSTFRLYGMF